MGSAGDEKGKINVPTRTAFTNEIGQTVPSVKENSSAHLSGLTHCYIWILGPHRPDGKKWPSGRWETASGKS